jgi:23S rRNA (uracil1939-C5)-methyltransferase
LSRKHRKFRLPAGVYEIEIDSLSHDGRGVGRVEGKAVFLYGALPGERVRFEYLATHRHYDEGRTLEILQSSPLRVKPQCAHFDQCGGCSLQHLAPDAQISFKQNQMLEDCRRIGGVEPSEILPPLQAEVWGYRHKARLGVRYVEKKGRVLIGFREKRSSFITDIERCEVLHPAIGGRIRLLEELVMSLSIRAAVPQIEVAAGASKQVLVFRVLQPLSADDSAKLAGFGREQGLAIYAQPQGADSIHPLYDPWTNESLYYYLPSKGPEIRIDFKPQDFTQVHPSINRLIVGQALRELAVEPQERVLDLFCGLGNFTIPLARQAAYAVGIEGTAEMVTRARENAQRNETVNIEFHVADLFQRVPDASWLRQPVDKVLLDPPRAGAREILPIVARLNPGRIVYISCNPSTLARDAGILVHDCGYRFVRAGVMDMFPHTSHVESMAVFER